MRRRFIRTVVYAAVGMAGMLFVSAQGGQLTDRPNFIVIYVDDLGFNDLGCYGAKDPAIRTPNLDRMAAEGMRFTDWFSACSVCAPSRAALLTGRYPQRCGLPVCPEQRHFGRDYEQNVGLQPSEITIAELLKPLGYATAMYGKSHLGYVKQFYPLQMGFDEYYGCLGNFPIGGTRPVLEGNEVVEPAMKYQDIHKKLTARTIEFMEKSQQQKKPFFIYLAHYLVHGPWDPNREFSTDGQWEIYQKQRVRGHLKYGGDKIYPAMVRELDWHVGEVLSALKEKGLDRNTMVVFMSDNGPWLPAGSAWPLRGSKFNTFEGGHRVPSLARWPGQIAPGHVSDKLCSTMDIFPTIARLAGAELPKDRVIDGIDISPILRGEKGAKEHDELYYYNGLSLEVIRDRKWKLHLPREPHTRVYWAKTPGYEGMAQLDTPVLYDLEEDVGERTDVSTQHPDVVRRMLALADKAREELGDWDRGGRDRKKLLDFKGNPNQPARQQGE